MSLYCNLPVEVLTQIYLYSNLNFSSACFCRLDKRSEEVAFAIIQSYATRIIRDKHNEIICDLAIDIETRQGCSSLFQTVIKNAGELGLPLPRRVLDPTEVNVLSRYYNDFSLKKIWPRITEALRQIDASLALNSDLSASEIRNWLENHPHLTNKVDLLDLCNLDLELLPLEINQFSCLKHLDISKNRLKKLPAQITRLQFLESLNANKNYLQALPPRLPQLTKLKDLYLSSNKMSSFSSEITEMENLIYLDLSNNQISSIPPSIKNMKCLRQLLLASNQFEIFPAEILPLTDLSGLDFSHNYLVEIPPEIKCFSKLRVLSFSDNKLQDLPQECAELKNLAEFDIRGNPFLVLPITLLKLDGLPQCAVKISRLTSTSGG